MEVTESGLHEEFKSLTADVRSLHKQLKQDMESQLRLFMVELRALLPEVKRPESRDRERKTTVRPSSKPADSKKDTNSGIPHPRSKEQKTGFTSSMPARTPPSSAPEAKSSRRDAAPEAKSSRREGAQNTQPRAAGAATLRNAAQPDPGFNAAGFAMFHPPGTVHEEQQQAANWVSPVVSPRVDEMISERPLSDDQFDLPDDEPVLLPQRLDDEALQPPAKKAHPAHDTVEPERARTPPVKSHTAPLSTVVGSEPFNVHENHVTAMTVGGSQIDIIESGPAKTTRKSWPKETQRSKTWNGDDKKHSIGNGEEEYGIRFDRFSSLGLSTQGVGCMTPSPTAVNCWLPQTYKDSSMVIGEDGCVSMVPLRRLDSRMTENEPTKVSACWALCTGQLHPWRAFWDFCKSDYFDYFMGIFLFLNAISIGVQVDVMTTLRDEGSSEIPLWLRIVDGIFCVVFLLELLIRAIMYNKNYFTMKGWTWNCFDLIVVIFSVIDEISKLFLTGTKVQEAIDKMGVLRMLRLARVLRLIRMVRLIPELKSMVYLIASSMGSFFWAVMLLLIMIYCLAVYFCELSTDLILKETLPTEESDNLILYYGSVATSIFSLFQAITGGDDWCNFINMFKKDNQFNFALNALVFMIYIGFATMVMLNLVTGVFVEGAQRIIQEDKEAEIVKNVRKLFHMTDADQSGEVSWEEFQAQLDNVKMTHYLRAVDMDPSEAKALFKLLDIDRSGELSVTEFVDGCLRMRVPARSIDINSLKYDFHDITSVWASQFAIIDTNIKTILDLQEKIAYAAVCTMPEETYLV